MTKAAPQTVGASHLSDGLGDDCPFSYGTGEELTEIQHKIIGDCVSCSEAAYTQSPLNDADVMCWGCAYDSAN
jgi:hypothetical protein